MSNTIVSSSTRLTVDLGILQDNWRSLAETAFGSECAGVVKADAYGVGVNQVVPALYKAGCRSFFVAHTEEGLDVRDLLPDVDIYVLNGFPKARNRRPLDADLIPVINNLPALARMRARRHAGGVPVALHVDTGLHRLGLYEDEVIALSQRRELLSNLKVKLVLSHLAVSELPDHPLNRRQRDRFSKALEMLPSARASLSATSGIFLGPLYHFDMVRAGAGLLGINPTPGKPNPMRPVVTLEARVLQTQDVKAGETVGYGADYLVERPARIATLSIGYADGVPRKLSNRGSVFAAGRNLPIVGRVSMDLMTIDISDVEPGRIAPGSFVELVGANRPLDEVATEAETIGYES